MLSGPYLSEGDVSSAPPVIRNRVRCAGGESRRRARRRGTRGALSFRRASQKRKNQKTLRDDGTRPRRAYLSWRCSGWRTPSSGLPRWRRPCPRGVQGGARIRTPRAPGRSARARRRARPPRAQRRHRALREERSLPFFASSLPALVVGRTPRRPATRSPSSVITSCTPRCGTARCSYRAGSNAELDMVSSEARAGGRSRVADSRTAAALRRLRCGFMETCGRNRGAAPARAASARAGRAARVARRPAREPRETSSPRTQARRRDAFAGQRRRPRRKQRLAGRPAPRRRPPSGACPPCPDARVRRARLPRRPASRARRRSPAAPPSGAASSPGERERDAPLGEVRTPRRGRVLERGATASAVLPCSLRTSTAAPALAACARAVARARRGGATPAARARLASPKPHRRPGPRGRPRGPGVPEHPRDVRGPRLPGLATGAEDVPTCLATWRWSPRRARAFPAVPADAVQPLPTADASRPRRAAGAR